MRIGVVTTSYPRFPGDPAGNFVAELGAWLQRRGHTIEVIAAGDPGTSDVWQDCPVRRVSAASGLFYQGGAPDALQRTSSTLGAATFSARLAVEVRRRAHRWDGVVAHWLAPSAIATALVAPRLPLWAIAHGGDVHLLRRAGLTRPAARLLDRPQVHVNFVSRALQSSFSEAAGPSARALVARSSVAPMGVDLEHFQQLPKQRAKNLRPVLLFLGRLVPIKGVDVLLEALPGLDESWQVVIAGAGPSEGALRCRARELGLSIHWAGEVHGVARDELLGRADVVVIPSRPDGGREEGMPRVALEALAAGAQLLVSDCGGLAEIPESICHRVASRDVAGLRSALEGLGQGARAAYEPGHWLADRGWDALAPRLLPGLGSGK